MTEIRMWRIMGEIIMTWMLILPLQIHLSRKLQLVRIKQELDRVSSQSGFVAAESARGMDITAVVLWCNCVGNSPDVVLLIYCIYVCTCLYRGCAWSVH